MKKTLDLDTLLKQIDFKIKTTARSIKASGVDAEDIAQEFRLKIVLEFARFNSKKAGWWVGRLKLYKKRFISKALYYSKRHPLDKAYSINVLHTGEDSGI